MKRLAERILLVGWDAADWEIIRPLMAAGQMPHLARLINAGASGELASLQPMLSPMLWTSIATGKRPHKHGIHGFTEPRPDGKGIRAIASTSRTTKAIWNILTQRGWRTHNLCWYASHPAEPVNGVSVSNEFSVAPPLGAPWPQVVESVHPPEIRDQLAALRMRPEDIRGQDLQSFIPVADRIDQNRDDRLLKCAVILAETATTHAAATWAMEHRPWDFVAVLYDAIDHFSHVFMDFHPPQQAHVSDEDFEIYRHVITTCYQFHDLMLGRLLELAGDDATVILVSDHGFRSGKARLPHTAKTLEGLALCHRPQGVCVMHGPAIRSGVRLDGASLLDVAPTVLALSGLPLGRDMDGRPWLEAFAADVEPEFTSSWDEVAGSAGLHPEEMRRQPTDSLQAVRHLIQLGYINAPGSDVRQAVDECLETNQFNLARAYLDAGLPQQAQTILEQLVAKRPEHLDYRQALAQSREAGRPIAKLEIGSRRGVAGN